MNKTGIDYLDFTWNPLAMRCTRISPACDHCWHLAMANRLAANPSMSTEARAAYAGETGPLLIESRLDEPVKCKKPAIVGVQFMGDLFHEDIPIAILEPIFETMQWTPWHTYLILTKRPERMEFAWRTLCQTFNGGYPTAPLDNVWLGVTVENQATADERIPLLLQTPAAVRFVSAEPLLGPVDLWPWLPINSGQEDYSDNPPPPQWEREYTRPDLENLLSLVITGGETGPGARPMHPDWARGLRDQCQASGVSYFFKQWGEWTSYHNAPDGVRREIDQGKYQDGFIDDEHVYRVGNKRAGKLLDGVRWDQMPEVAK